MERTITLQFVKEFSTAGLKLIEVDEELLKTIEQDNGSVAIKGGADDDAVLCTSSQTFSLKQLESTNTMLMIPEKQLLQSGKAEICGQAGSHYELLLTAPRLGKLKQLLSKDFYKGPSHMSTSADKYTFADLVKLVQASDAEIRRGLQELHAVEVAGHWRLVDPDYISEIVNWLSTLILEKGWSWKEVSLSAALKEMKTNPDPVVLRNVLESYGSRAGSSAASTPTVPPASPAKRPQESQPNDITLSDLFSIDAKKLAVFFAIRLLTMTTTQSGTGFPLQEFLDSWSNFPLPEGFTPTVDLLKGVAIIEHVGNLPFVRYFPASTLPTNARGRLQELFRVRAKWTLEDIKPYIIDIVEPGSTIDALLVKNTRVVSGPNNTKLYCSRE